MCVTLHFCTFVALDASNIENMFFNEQFFINNFLINIFEIIRDNGLL